MVQFWKCWEANKEAERKRSGGESGVRAIVNQKSTAIRPKNDPKGTNNGRGSRPFKKRSLSKKGTK